MEAMKNTATAKIAVGVTAIVMVVSGFAAFASTAAAATDVATLCALAKQLNISTPEFDALCAGEGTVTTVAGGYVHHPAIDYEFNQNLYLGSRGNDVLMLQKVLNLDAATQVAVSGAGSPGNETSYFGPATRAAVIKFQNKWGISPAAGYFYPLTRAEMNKKSTVVVDNGNGDNGNDVEGDVLDVEEGDQPDSMEVGPGQQHIPTTVVEMTTGDEDVMVETITVEVTGAGRDAVDSVTVWYDGKVVDTDSVNSTHEAELKMDMDIDDGETVELTFSVTMEASVASEDGLKFKVEVVEIQTDGADVDGLPVSGARHEVNENVALNKFSMDVDVESTEVSIGDKDELLATVNFENDDPENDNDSMFVKGFALEQTGTISANDIDNVYVLVDDEEYDADVEGDYYVFDFGNGIEIEDGDDMDFEIYADIMDGATETINFALDNDDLVDMVFVMDEDDRYLAETSTAGTYVNVSGGPVTIEQGSGNSSDSNEVNDGNITAGEEAAEFASFDLDVEGEAVTGDVVVNIAVANGSNTTSSDIELRRIKIVDEDGNTVATADDDTVTSTTTIVVEFDDVTFKKGDMTYIIIADVPDDVTDGTTYTMGNIVFSSFEGDDSGETLTISTVTPGTVQTVQGAALAIGVDDSIADDEIRDDVDGVELAVIQLDATDSGEDIEVTNIALDFTVVEASGTDVTYADITNCVLVNEDGEEVSDSTDLSALLNQDFDMDANFMVEENTVVALSLQCDISDDFAANDTILVVADAGNTDAEADVAGDIVVTAISGGNTGDTITIVAATLTTSDDEDPEFQSVRVGTTVDLGSIEIDNENVSGILDELPLEITGRTLLNSSRKVTIKDAEGDVVAYAYFTTATTVVEDWVKDVVLADEEPVVLYLSAALSESVATEGSDLSVFVNGDVSAVVDGDSYSVATTTLTTLDVYSGLPAIVMSDITTGDLSDDVVMRFAITAEGEDIVIASTTAATVTVTGSATTSTLTIYAGTSHDNAVSEDVTLSAANYTIGQGKTRYFVVKGAAVSEGDNGDIIQTTVSLDGKLFVGTWAAANEITVVEGDDVNSSEALVYKYTN